MSEVTLQILGRPYTIACEEGQESHIEKLGSMIESKLSNMQQLAPQRSQNLLFAALFLADELVDARQSGATDSDIQAQLEAARTTQQENEAVKQELKLERDALISERDNLRAEHEALKSEFTRVEARLNETNEQIEQMSLASTAHDDAAKVKPRLKELASALEKCAQELESKASAT